MRIAIYIENLFSPHGGGGAEIYGLKLAEVLSHNNRVVIFTKYNKAYNVNPTEVFKRFCSKELKIKKIFLPHYKNHISEFSNRIIFWIKLFVKIVYRYDVFINCWQNRLVGFKKIFSVHLIHFPVDTYLKFFPMSLGKFMNDFYRKSYKLFICNSEFTKHHLKRIWNVDGIVLNPPINMIPVDKDVLESKKKQILMVGRLVPDKKVKEILEMFVSPSNSEIFKDFEFVVVGNKNMENLNYFDMLKIIESKSNVRIVSDASYFDLVNYYKESEFFIHAKGYGIDEEKEPLLTEHFGMVTVEAMANGCIPIVIKKAGQKEIVENGVDGFLWNELFEIPMRIAEITKNELLKKRLQINAVEKSKRFLMPEFEKKVQLLFESFITYEKNERKSNKKYL